jgi:tetratricopeptide (TPR) repeat protein
MNMGDEAMEREDMPLAMKHYSTAEALFPRNLEMRFWHAVTLANNGRLDEALPIFRRVFAKDRDWRELGLRLVSLGMLKLDEKGLERMKKE